MEDEEERVSGSLRVLQASYGPVHPVLLLRPNTEDRSALALSLTWPSLVCSLAVMPECTCPPSSVSSSSESECCKISTYDSTVVSRTVVWVAVKMSSYPFTQSYEDEEAPISNTSKHGHSFNAELAMPGSVPKRADGKYMPGSNWNQERSLGW